MTLAHYDSSTMATCTIGLLHTMTLALWQLALYMTCTIGNYKTKSMKYISFIFLIEVHISIKVFVINIYEFKNSIGIYYTKKFKFKSIYYSHYQNPIKI